MRVLSLVYHDKSRIACYRGNKDNNMLKMRLHKTIIVHVGVYRSFACFGFGRHGNPKKKNLLT